jgi:5'-3' exoribonuclease 1
LFLSLRFYIEEPPGTQKVYLGKTAPPSKVIQLTDKEQSNWTKEIQGISEQ